ncbi:MAG: 4Fe-4S dicluster domain-containing protein [Deltaproteobacteria bacterium]|nr:4Fe-4S dicluster domain-containing protein [Deltaproteobacteria bacterium]
MNNAVLKDRFFENYHGEEIQNCIQCGSCSGSCPLAPHMDYGPRQLFELAREGDMEDVLRANTMWLCVSCYNCVVKCPRDIVITDHMYSLKKMALKEGLQAPKIKLPALYEAFKGPVERYGKISDIQVMNRYAFRWPLDVMRNTFLAIKLAKRKRLEFRMDLVKNLAGFQKVMKKARELEKTS